ncbi:anillin-like isoform X2 [Microplitis mediator]|uniref:anillin-like isoform X2 n=1 Tax=Microplitis mediator TaxID=375433 RepID=UPI002557294F|nr:anillin-like isoform X2 [Microplitis mediator]
MDPFTQRMLERAKARREKLDTQLSNAGHEIKRRSPLKEATINIPSPVKTPPKLTVQENKENTTTLAANVKSKLDRLGKLYSDEDRELLSSPIHRTEEKFSAEETSDVSASKKCGVGGARLDRLAALASTINNWEDDLSHPTVAPKEPIRKTNTRFNYKPSPTKAQERSVRASSIGRDVPEKKKLVSEKTKTPEKAVPSTSKTPEKSVASTSKDRQGSYRTPEKSTKEVASGNRTPSSLATKAKDPAEMSLSERMAMFERNKGEALIPKAPLSLPVSTKKLMECQKVCNQTSTDQRSKVNTGTQNRRALFEGLPKQQLENDILRDTQAERKKELEMLRSRFNKNKESAQAAAGSCIRPRNNSDGSPKNSPVCPVKPTPATEQAPPPPPPLPSAQESRTPTKRQVTTLKAPAVQTTRTIFSDVKRIKVSPPKPGHLYPDLTAIESSETETTDSEYTVGTTEAETATLDEPTDTETDLDDYYGLEQEVSTNCDDSNTSFENSIMRVVKESKKSNSCNKRQIESDESSTSDISVLDEMDEYLDECLALQEAQNHGPTPPKQNRAGNSPSMASTSFKYSQNIYKSPIKITPSGSPRKKDQYIIDGGQKDQVPLMHSVSFYRRQQCEAAKTPVRQVKRSVESTDCEEPTDDNETAMVQVKIKQLMEDVCKQQTVIGQASQALNLCTATVEFSGSREQVEGERLLLVATHRRHAALNEIQRMRVEGTLRPVLPGSSPRQESGSLTISALTLPLKRDHSFNINSDMCLHFLCLIRHLDTVIATPVVQVDRNDSCIRFPSTIKLDDLYSDFKITIEVYSLETRAEILPHEIKYHIKDSNKKYSKYESKLIKPSHPSPGGPGAVRSPSFSLTGYVVFSLKEINRNQFTLNKVPRNSSLEGHLLMHVSCELNISIEHRGFLTMFEDIGGCGSWRRRWCLLKGDTLSSWTYPEDENKKTPVDSLGLREVITTNVSLVSRDICARPNTFLLETMRRAQPNDKDSLVVVKNGPNTTIRHLLSADTKEERLKWCSKINSSLNLIRAWGGISPTN